MLQPDSGSQPTRPDDKIKLGSPFIGVIGPHDVAAALTDLSGRLAWRPDLVMEEGGRLLATLGQGFDGSSSLTPAKGDRRFADAAWRSNPFHRLSLHAYLAWTTALDRLIDRVGADDKTTARLRYITSLFTDALSPDNSLLGNPAALKRLLETGGGSLVSGMRNLLIDAASHQDAPAQVDKSAFTIGGNIAATPGAVVYRHELLELIQYSPTTGQVHEIPLMMVPPVVNKFYMMDLAPGRSLVEFLVARGFQVFMLSWRNPGPEHADMGLDAYVAAMMDAAEAIREISGSADINTFTICTGAVPLAAFLGHLAARKQGGIRSATMVVSILDSNEGRSLGLFATPETIAAAKRRSAERGLLSGEEMARVFTWMRPRDLVWNYWVNNYLMGNQPPAHDVLYWNNDSTRLTARLHSQLLDVFADDVLVSPGSLSVLGTPLDLRQVACDRYVVAGMTDHISVWKGVYASAGKMGGRFNFVLHSSGHVQSVVNPPGTPKAKYWTNPLTPDTPEDWLSQAQPQPDSWWVHWAGWLADRSGNMVCAPSRTGSQRHPVRENAPGAYVLEP
ncbi:class II poly(R)-hydroxyalkanoic acid synthase [Paramagnetospirillum marisnigri]|uniref:Class II poly(R)-hydroxyalkanoic acid synthase n=2 Tax=Paramagnetospirillum marisnigri TaxID=1285242 RepID=A0A178M6D1_9PROT|nr:class II poly(R)-hydroxyalkanoic acid synthase [Paramagnetospirillum marisnigri]